MAMFASKLQFATLVDNKMVFHDIDLVDAR